MLMTTSSMCNAYVADLTGNAPAVYAGPWEHAVLLARIWRTDFPGSQTQLQAGNPAVSPCAISRSR